MHRPLMAVALAFIFGMASTLFAQQPVPTGSFAIEHVSVIDIETGRRVSDRTVVVVGNRIATVGPANSVEIPDSARIVDGRGKFLIPGIWDMHVHAMRSPLRVLPLAVANGITGLRDMGAKLENAVDAREAIRNGLVSPRLFLAGEGLDGIEVPPNGLPPHPVVRTPEEGRAIVRRLDEGGVDFIKVHNGLARETFYAVADEAKKRRLHFDGHLAPETDIIEASDAGQRAIEHLSGLQVACAANPGALRTESENPPPIEIDREKCEATIRHLVLNGTWLTPMVGAPGRGDPRTRQFNLAITRMASQGGLRLLAGTDWPGRGFALGDYSGTSRTIMAELAGLVEAGLTPQEALRTATINPAILWNMRNDLGSVEAGKLADLLLLDGDPLADITNTGLISAVIINGRLIDSDARQRLLADEQAARSRETGP